MNSWIFSNLKSLYKNYLKFVCYLTVNNGRFSHQRSVQVIEWENQKWRRNLRHISSQVFRVYESLSPSLDRKPGMSVWSSPVIGYCVLRQPVPLLDFSVKGCIGNKMASVKMAAAKIGTDFNCAKCLECSKSFNGHIITGICHVVTMF